MIRFEQIAPKIFFTSESYRYNGKTYPLYDKVQAIVASLPTITNIIVVGHLQRNREPLTPFPADSKRKWSSYGDVMRRGEKAGPGSCSLSESMHDN